MVNPDGIALLEVLGTLAVILVIAAIGAFCEWRSNVGNNETDDE